jgi:hypothetical protein
MFKKKTLDDQIAHDLIELEREIHAAELTLIQHNATLAWHRQKLSFLLRVQAARQTKPNNAP